MSVEEWVPSDKIDVNLEKLKQYVEFFATADPADLGASLADENIAADRTLMQRQAIDWQIADQLTDTELISLIRFFTLAEMQLPGWDGGRQSPVIYLVKILRGRSGFDSELRKWIKANTDNRYLPNGAVL